MRFFQPHFTGYGFFKLCDVTHFAFFSHDKFIAAFQPPQFSTPPNGFSDGSLEFILEISTLARLFLNKGILRI